MVEKEPKYKQANSSGEEGDGKQIRHLQFHLLPPCSLRDLYRIEKLLRVDYIKPYDSRFMVLFFSSYILQAHNFLVWKYIKSCYDINRYIYKNYFCNLQNGINYK